MTTGQRMRVDIERQEERRACVVHLAGDIDVAVVPGLQGALEHVIGTGCENIVLDLAHVTYADSSALNLLVWLDRRLQGHEGKAILAGANKDVSRILELTGLLSVASCLTETRDLDAAVACFDVVESDLVIEWIRSLDMPAEVDSLAGVRDQVYELVSSLDFNESALFDIKVAVGEALANAIRHGSSREADSRIRVDVTAYADRVAVRVTDSGRGFDGEHACSDDLYAVGGRGVMFMRALMDQVAFCPLDSGGTEVTLVKLRPFVRRVDTIR
ncbi:MAG TPA: anti-sigma factor antagonist [Coriobacteriia bacterium]|nr:anti-sigma factor antagonist [Coriobacteriia bacterium]